MAGRGFLEEAVPVDTGHIFVLRNGRWLKMYRPVNPDRHFSGTCLAESFAELYAKVHQVDVGLIPCADGGTSLEQWQPGSLLFDNAIYQARLASRTSIIAGVLWHQGESDCIPARYVVYKERFETLMSTLRRELDLQDVPFLLGGLGDYLANFSKKHIAENYSQVNDVLQEIAAANSMTGFVSAQGLTSNPDYLHFNAASLYEFGKRYYAEFQRLRDPNKVFPEKPMMDAAVRSPMELL